MDEAPMLPEAAPGSATQVGAAGRLRRCADRLDDMAERMIRAMAAESVQDRDDELWVAYILAAAAGFDSEVARRLMSELPAAPSALAEARQSAIRADAALRRVTETLVLLRCHLDMANSLAGEQCLLLIAGAEEPLPNIAVAVDAALYGDRSVH